MLKLTTTTNVFIILFSRKKLHITVTQSKKSRYVHNAFRVSTAAIICRLRLETTHVIKLFSYAT